MSFVATMDTLKFSKRMQKAGLNEKAANELAEAIKEVQDESITNLITKQDLEITKKDIIIKLGSLTILTGITMAGFLSWFLPIVITKNLN